MPWGIIDCDLSYTLSNYNIGDGIQALAVKNLKQIISPKSKSIFISRENITFYNDKPVLLPMQGYFFDSKFFLPVFPITPLWIGVRLNYKARDVITKLVETNYDYFCSLDIGCRDISTNDFFELIGIKSHFSRCMTLTFPKRGKVNADTVFIVDVPNKLHKYIPSKIRKFSVIKKQRAVPFRKYFTPEKRLEISEKTLNLYRETASLVITSALHCACPCIAMGIPVVFVDFGWSSNRFSCLKNIIPIYSKSDFLNGDIDFLMSYPPPQKKIYIESLKDLVIQNFKLFLVDATSGLNSLEK